MTPPKVLSWIKRQGMRWAVLATKIFLPYFLYQFIRKIFYRLIPASQRGEEQNKENLLWEEDVPDIFENRRIVGVAGSRTFLFYLQYLRDSFPDDDRFRFGWAEFQASGLRSLFLFPNFLEKKKIFFSMETPIIGRHYFNNPATQPKGYFRVGLHGSVTLHRSEFNLPSQSNDTRLKTILHKTRTLLQPYRKRGEHILYPLQVPYDQTLQGVNPFQSAQYDLINIRRYTSRPIVLTVNPFMIRRKWHTTRLQPEDYRDYMALYNLCKKLGVMFYDDFKKEEKTSSIFLKDCWCVVCHASSFTVESVLAGIPAFTLNPANFVYPICSHELREIENPKMPDRIPWLSRLAYCQWTLAEIENGDVWRHFQPTVESLLKKG